MAKNDPKFVRLTERLNTGCIGDTLNGTDFFIGGKDIKPFPSDDDPAAQDFVRGHLRAGLLEAASKKERTIVEDAAQAMRDMHLGQLDDHEAHDRAGHQESQIQSLARLTQMRLDKERLGGDDEDEDDEEEIPASSRRRRVGAKGKMAPVGGDSTQGVGLEGHSDEGDG